MSRLITARGGAGLLVGLGMLLATQVGAQTGAGGGGGDTAFPPGEITDLLRARIGKPVTLLLRSGKDYGGTVGEVRSQSVVLRSLAGKEFYDALVRLDEIAGVELRRER